jgi:ribosomal protein L11 methyltransferase
VPYRVDVKDPSGHAADALIELGALDVDVAADGIAAIMPDAVAPEAVARAVGNEVGVSPAIGRDDDSVWTVSPRQMTARGIRLIDSPAFGTGLHATTALCLEALDDLVEAAKPARLLDVGTGSGILALAALRRGVGRAVGLDIDPMALHAAAENARLNALDGSLDLVRGGADAVRGSWPLVVANIRAAELIEMAPSLVRRLESRGRLVLSGIPHAVAADVTATYRRLGMREGGQEQRAGWTALVMAPSW